MANYIELGWTEKNPTIAATINRLLKTPGAGFNPSDLLSDSISITPGPTSIQIVAQIPLVDDISMELKSNFSKASEIVGQFAPGVSSFIQMAKTLTTAFSGTSSSFYNVFDLLVWQETEPIKIDFDAIFFTRHNPKKDVAIPALSLCNMTILSSVPGTGGTLVVVPGVSLSTLSSFKTRFQAGAPAEEGFGNTPAKLLSFRIPGIINFPSCVLEQAKPTFSKEVTESGVPLWIKVACTVRTTMPAFDELLFSELNKPTIEVGTLTSIGSEAIQLFR